MDERDDEHLDAPVRLLPDPGADHQRPGHHQHPRHCCRQDRRWYSPVMFFGESQVQNYLGYVP